jgi:hypothetical protein
MRLARPRVQDGPIARIAPIALTVAIARAVAVGAALIALPACVVHAGPPPIGGYDTVYADGVPTDIYGYPHVWYEGGYAYLVGDRWYYPSSSGWLVLRSEPPELYRYRSSYRVRSAPPVGQTYRQAAPPAYPQPAPYLPPPAERVR